MFFMVIRCPKKTATPWESPHVVSEILLVLIDHGLEFRPEVLQCTGDRHDNRLAQRAQ